MNNKVIKKVMISQSSGNDDQNIGEIQESADRIIDISHRRLS